MPRILAALALWLGLAGAAMAQNALPPVSTQFTAYFGSVAAITRVIPGITGKRIYLTQLSVSGASTSVFTLSYGTGTNCGTGTTTISTTTFASGQAPTNLGDGSGAVAVIPAGQDVCITIATAVAPGWLSWAQF